MRSESTKRSAARKIAFLVEGDKDKLLVEALAWKLAGRHRLAVPPCFTTIRLAGTPRAGISSVVELLLTRQYERFFILFDTGTTHLRRAAALAEEIHEPLVRARLADRVVLVPVMPSIERWVLADAEAVERVSGRRLTPGPPRGHSSPREVLEAVRGGWGLKEQRRVARHLDPERIRSRDPGFAAFARALEAAMGVAAHGPTEAESLGTA